MSLRDMEEQYEEEEIIRLYRANRFSLIIYLIKEWIEEVCS